MRWLTEFSTQDEFLKVGEGEFVYYPERPIGPGILLSDEERAEYLSYQDMIWWAILAALLIPNRWVVARLLPFESGSFVAEVFELALPICLLLLLYSVLNRKAEGYLKHVGRRRSLDFCEEDNRQLTVREAEREINPWLYLRIIGFFVAAFTFGSCLDGFFLSFF